MTQSKRIKLIANPASGMGWAAGIAPRVVYELHKKGYYIDFHYTRTQGEASKLAHESDGYSKLVFVGGDGTLHEIVNGLPLKNRPVLAAVPAGTGNAFGKELKLPWEFPRLVDIIENGKRNRWDVCLNKTIDKKFILFAGAGFHTEVIRHFHINRRGPAFIGDYVKWTIHVASYYKLPSVTVEVDGKIVETESAWVEVFNISQYGGPLRIAPHANPSDGYLDVMILRGNKYRQIGRLITHALLCYILGWQHKCHDIIFLKGKNIRLYSRDKVPYHMDGEFYGYLPCELEVIPEKVTLLGPG